jgi:DNA polymerase (family 10)
VNGPRIPLGRAWAIAQRVIDAASDDDTRITPVGSLRRFEATVGDVSLLVATPSATDLFDRLARADGLAVRHRTRNRCVLQMGRDTATVHTTVPEVSGAALLHHTGSRSHIAGLTRRAETRGIELGPTGLRGRQHGEALASDSEARVYELLDLPFIAPELRQGHDELEAAEAGRLPTLVERRHIRGDLHMHSIWSDGHDSIAAMIETCVALGYEYVAITDHSGSSRAAGGLTAELLQRQRREIDELRGRFPAIAVLHGAEVDILPDGRLDYTDEVLAELDIVLASLHDAAGHDDLRLTERYLSAMRHPLVNIITHPTNRLIGHRAGYNLDFPRLFATAVETGTVLEIDGAPGHLDMDGMLARRAVEAGVMVSIDSDCHRSLWLDRQMTFGLGTARRGWVEPHQVLNTRPLAGLREILAGKRTTGTHEMR